MDSKTGKTLERTRNTGKTQKSQDNKSQETTSKDSGQSKDGNQKTTSKDSGQSKDGNQKNDEFWSREYHYAWVLSASPVAFTLSSLKSYLVFLFLFFSNSFSLLCI